MAKTKVSKGSFSGGIITPQAFGATEQSLFQLGAKDIVNAYALPVGGVVRREGLRHLDFLSLEVSYDLEKVKTVPFFRGAKDGVLVFFYASLNQGPFPGPRILVKYYQAPDPGFIGIDSSSSSVEVPFFNADGLGIEYWFDNFDYTIIGDELLLVMGGNRPIKIGIQFGNFEVYATEVSFPTYLNSSTPKIPVIAFDGSTIDNPSGFGLVLSSVSGEDVKVDLSINTSFFLPSDEGAARIYGKEGGVLFITKYEGPFTVYGVVRVEFPDKIVATDAFYIERGFEPVWSDARGWPVSVSFYQNRLFFGGSTKLPLTIWGSAVSDFFNFDFSSGLDSDPVEGTISSGVDKRINYLSTGRALFIFTDSSEYYVNQGNSSITPSNFGVKKISSSGSPRGTLKPFSVDGSVIFVTKDKRAIRELVFSDKEDSYIPGDLNDLVSHLFDQKEILSISFSSYSNLVKAPVVYVVTSPISGPGYEMLALVKSKDRNINSWSRFSSESLNPLSGGDTSAFRYVTGVGGLIFVSSFRGDVFRLELLDKTYRLDSSVLRDDGVSLSTAFLTTESGDFLGTSTFPGNPDSFKLLAVLGDSGLPTDFSGLEHLEGQDVGAFIFGNADYLGVPAWLPNQSVTGGICSLSVGTLSAEIGVPFLSYIETVPLDVDLGFDSSFGDFKTIPKIELDVLNSRNVFIAVNNKSSVKEYRKLDSNFFSQSLSLYTGWKRFFISSDFSKEVFIKIFQDSPYEFNVRAIAMDLKF